MSHQPTDTQQFADGPPVDGAAPPETQEEPWGAQFLRRMHADMGHLLQDYDELMGPLEQEHVKRIAAKVLADHDRHMSLIEKAFAKFYGHLPPLENADDGFADGVEDDLDAADVPDDAATPTDAPVETADGPPPVEGQAPPAPAAGPVPPPTDQPAGDAVAADSVEDEREPEPSGDEVVEGMERGRDRAAGKKALGCKCCGRAGCKGCKACKSCTGCKSIGRKAHEPKDAAESRRCGWGQRHDLTGCEVDPRGPHAPKKDKAAPGTPGWVEEEMAEPEHQNGVQELPPDGPPEEAVDEDDISDPRDRQAIIETCGFFGEIGQPQSLFDEEHRLKAYHYHKTLEGIASLDVARDSLRRDDGIPPARWEPGAGAKAVRRRVYNRPVPMAVSPRQDGQTAAWNAAMTATRYKPTPRKDVGAYGQKNPAMAALAAPEVQAALSVAQMAQAKKDDKDVGAYGQKNPAMAALAAPEVMAAVGAAGAMGGNKRQALGEASGWLRELSTCRTFGDPHREKSLAYHKMFDTMIKAWAPDDEELEEESDEELAEDDLAPEENGDVPPELLDDDAAPQDGPPTEENGDEDVPPELCDDDDLPPGTPIEPGEMDTKSIDRVCREQYKQLVALSKTLEALRL